MGNANKAAIVTGGSAGIGLAIAEVLAEEGYDLTIAARDPDKLAAAADQLRRAGVGVVTVPVNLAHGDECKAVVSRHLDEYGRVDVLVNNAGLGLPGDIEHLPEGKLDLHLNLNLRSAYLMMQRCIPSLKQAGAQHGKALIVNVSSLLGKLPSAGVAAYSMTKAGLVALSQAAHGELSTSGIQVTAICPGAVHTPGASWMKMDANAMIQASDVAEAVRFLLRTSPSCIVPDITLTTPGSDVHSAEMPH